MEKSEFERKINSLVPCPDQKTTADLFALGRELGEEIGYGSPQDILNSLSFISRHFDQKVTQGVYEIIQYGSALPDEMVAAAVHMASRDCSPQQMAQAANNGELMCFHTPKDAEELSPLTVCTVCEADDAVTAGAVLNGVRPPLLFPRRAPQQTPCAARSDRVASIPLPPAPPLCAAVWQKCAESLSQKPQVDWGVENVAG